MKLWSKPCCSCVTVVPLYIIHVTARHPLQVRSRWMQDCSVAAFADTWSMYDPVASATVCLVMYWCFWLGWHWCRCALGQCMDGCLHACYCRSTFHIYTVLLWPTPYHITRSAPPCAPDYTAAHPLYASLPGPYAAVMADQGLSHISKQHW